MDGKKKKSKSTVSETVASQVFLRSLDVPEIAVGLNIYQFKWLSFLFIWGVGYQYVDYSSTN